MPAVWLSRLKGLLEGDPALNWAANDPADVAELLLLFRMILADGDVEAKELATFRSICRDAFGIGDDSLDAVMEFIEEMDKGVSQAQTLAVFRSFTRQRRIALARRMAAIAQADEELRRHEQRFMVRVLDVLDLDRADIATAK